MAASLLTAVLKPTALYPAIHLYRNLSVRTFSLASAQSARKYTEKHEWVAMDGKVGTVGVTDYAQQALGDIVYAQLPDIGSSFNKDDDFGALESVKAASELYSPVSGKVLDKNTDVEEKPSLINTSCYNDGWLVKMELTNESELDKLMDEPGYKEFLKSQE